MDRRELDDEEPDFDNEGYHYRYFKSEYEADDFNNRMNQEGYTSTLESTDDGTIVVIVKQDDDDLDDEEDEDDDDEEEEDWDDE